ncbi:MAG: alpha/beta hydrolase fold domain-containing protein [Thermomicrobiales bacterium]|nr:alpha/beta hydrolase fold domain-containing protein [Hyphomicrobiales bacterium]
MAPNHPFPAALEDAVAVYGELLKDYSPKAIVFHGESGGRDLITASALLARDRGMSSPAGNDPLDAGG